MVMFIPTLSFIFVYIIGEIYFSSRQECCCLSASPFMWSDTRTLNDQDAISKATADQISRESNQKCPFQQLVMLDKLPTPSSDHTKPQCRQCEMCHYYCHRGHVLLHGETEQQRNRDTTTFPHNLHKTGIQYFQPSDIL